MVARLADVAVGRWRLTLGVWLVVLVLGVLSYSTLLDREGFPAIETPLVLVSGPFLVDDAERVDAEAAVPLVDTYAELDGVVRVDSLAEANGYSLIVEFEGVSAEEGAAAMRIATPGIGFAFGPRIRPVDTTKVVESFEILVSVSAPAARRSKSCSAWPEPSPSSSGRRKRSPGPNLSPSWCRSATTIPPKTRCAGPTMRESRSPAAGAFARR